MRHTSVCVLNDYFKEYIEIKESKAHIFHILEYFISFEMKCMNSILKPSYYC